MRIEGYWAQTPDDTSLPYPQADAWTREKADEFLRRLDALEAPYTESLVGARGFSLCRLCGDFNGSAEYCVGSFRWPEGLRHYIDEHLVRPSQPFIDFVSAQT